MLHSGNTPEKKFPLIRFSSILIVTLVLFMGIGWQFWFAYKNMEIIQVRVLRMQELVGIITHLDEVLTMSARMGAETGNTQWEKRYLKFEPQLDNAIKEAKNLTPDSFQIEAAVQTDAANIELVAMEKHAFELVRQGQKDDALTILFSDGYEEQKRRYAKAIEQITTSIRMNVKKQLRESGQQAFFSIVAICITLPILIVLWIYVLRLMKKYNIERKQSEREVKELNESLEQRVIERTADVAKLSHAIKYSSAMIVITDTKGRIEYANPMFTQITGHSQEETIGKNPRILKSGKTPPEVYKELWKVVTSGKEWRGEFCNRKKNGELYWESASISPVKDDKGAITNFISVKNDITERRKMEEELIKAQKLESIGILAGGIAHDFNNCLQSILGYIALAKMHTNPNDEIHEYLEGAGKVILQSRGLTQQLLTFSKGGAPVKNTISVTELVTNSTKLALSGSNVKCELGIPDGLWLIDADNGQINQVISNLIINADQAMFEGGNIKIWAENINVVEKDPLPLQKGRYVNISIEDNGKGISQKNLQKIFDPYFTTKKSGSGLGLATVYSIIKKHDGYITVESEIGVGTTFHMYLPASDKEIQNQSILQKDEDALREPAEGEDEEKPVISKGKILLMDDEYVIRTILCKQLGGLKYEVEAVEEGSEAIRLYEQASRSGNPFDAVIMDLTISGGMGGKDTIKKLLEIDPQVKSIVMSGYANDPIMANYKKNGFRGVLAKPHEIHELDETLQKVISRN